MIVRRVSVPVTDQDRARRFYEEVLGLTTVQDLPVPMGDNARWIELAPAGGGASLVLVTWLPKMKAGSIDGLMLEVGDLPSICDQIRTAGVDVDGPFETPWGRQANLADPDGNGLVLAERSASTE